MAFTSRQFNNFSGSCLSLHSVQAVWTLCHSMLSNHINVRYYNHGLNDPFLPRVTSNFGASVGGPPHNMSALCVLSVQALVFLRRRAHGRRLAATGSSHRSVSLLSAPHTSSSETWPLKCLRRIEEESPFLSGVRSGGETPRLPPC